MATFLFNIHQHVPGMQCSKTDYNYKFATLVARDNTKRDLSQITIIFLIR